MYDIQQLGEWCPIHHTTDNCLSSLEDSWKRMKERHAANCKETNCEVVDDGKFIRHGSSTVHANVEIFWRNRAQSI